MLGLLIAQPTSKCLEVTPFGPQIQSAVQKVLLEMSDPLDGEWERIQKCAPFSGGRKLVKFNAAVFDLVRQAVRDRAEIGAMYRTLGKLPRARRIRPYFHTLQRNGWVLYGVYPDQPAIYRTFLFSGLLTAELTGEKFERDPKFDPEKVHASSIGLYGGEPQRVRQWLDRIPAQYIDENELHDNQKITLNEDGTAELTMDVAVNPELRREVLGWGALVRVLEPESLRQQVLEETNKMLSQDS